MRLLSEATDRLRSNRLLLVILRAGQNSIICSREPKSCPEHPGRQQIPDLFWLQCLDSLSVTYRPESIFACTTALFTSNEFEPQVVLIILSHRALYSSIKDPYKSAYTFWKSWLVEKFDGGMCKPFLSIYVLKPFNMLCRALGPYTPYFSHIFLGIHPTRPIS